MSCKHFRELSDDDIRQMAYEAEIENLLLPRDERKPRGWHFRRAAIIMGITPLSEITVDELAWVFARAMLRVSGV